MMRPAGPKPQPKPDESRDAFLWWILAICAAMLATGVITWFARGGGW